MKKTAFLILLYFFFAHYGFADDYTVEGVFNSGDKNMAIINGNIVSEGDSIAGAQIGKITKDSVEISINGEKKVLKIGKISSVSSTSNAGSTGAATKSSSPSIQPSSPIWIVLNPTVELDFKTKKEIYELRTRYVMQYPDLAGKLGKKNYVPSEEVFGQIIDARPWWGTVGQTFHGPGKRSIDGASEETRFLINPYLLVGLTPPNAHIVNDPNIAPAAIFPEPFELKWDVVQATATVKYDVSTFWDRARQYHFPEAQDHSLELIGYNAEDFGFKYLYIEAAKSRNVSVAAGSNVVQLKQFIHCGPSCGYPGGCNNMSPYQPELRITANTPATLYLKLWRKMPSSYTQQPDMNFIIEMR
ncbi:MAG: hypothetical protein PHT41_04230 [Candidatus Omnitrophica bacterium]|nr:hypothetical protein [Candidatus Omnitrophota bacterium]MDD5237539.1 hypothetical protein [Candidatus Omnitrophota bacterium]